VSSGVSAGRYRSLLACALAVTLSSHVRATDDLPVVRANSSLVDVEDGGRLLRGIWTVSPETTLDVYEARRAVGERRVTFRTDVDSISFEVRPGQHYDFAVLLNGTRCCHTRISTKREVVAGEAVVPFTLGRDGKIHVTGQFNDSEPLDLLVDLGAVSTVVYPSALAKGVSLRVDCTIANLGTGSVAIREISNINRVTDGSPPVAPPRPAPNTA
jgi:hypothetical protein